MVLPIGVNPGEFIPHKQKTDKNCIRLLSVARLVEKKGLYYSISAFHQLVELHPNTFYHIVGDGELMKPLKELVTFLGLEEKVIFY